MALQIKSRLADRSNFSAGRGGKKIRFIVIHYTANDGDTAAGNANYFSSPGRGASAHYFVDEREAYKTVLNGNTAWHCGAKAYKHPEARNQNSVGIEICSRRNNHGNYYFKPEAVKNAAELTRQVMQAYSIPKERVLRHYDVTGKTCPAPFVTDPAQWRDFLAML